jgi:hypothetical protein
MFRRKRRAGAARYGFVGYATIGVLRRERYSDRPPRDPVSGPDNRRPNGP